MQHFDLAAYKARRARLGYIEAKPFINPIALSPNKQLSNKIEEQKIDTHQFIINRFYPINKTPDELLNAISNSQPRTPISTIITAVSNELKIDKKTIISRDKRDEIVYARYLIFWLCRQAEYSQPEIGRRMDGRDHTTVLNGLRKFEKHLAEDGQYAAVARRLYRDLIISRPAPYWGA